VSRGRAYGTRLTGCSRGGAKDAWREVRPEAGFRCACATATVGAVTGYAFISYSHYDAREYVDRLATYLEDKGVAVWYDNELITGDRWVRVIEQKLCAATVVISVMTPAGDESAGSTESSTKPKN
jgi:hypothetical protein